MKKSIFILAASFTTLYSNAQNVAISNTNAAPNASAMLDIVSTSSGLLIPRVALTALNASGPVTSPATSLLVYNTATAGTTPNAVTPGFYYWDGSKWVAFMGSGGRDWSLVGNAGTTVGTNFLGTTDAVALAFNTNATERMRILSTGAVAVNSTSTFGTSTLFSAATGNNNAVDGSAAGSGAAVYGQNTGTGQAVFGLTNNASGTALYGSNLNAAGTAVFGIGQNAAGYSSAAGSGAAFSGASIGIVANASSATGTAIRVGGQGILTYPALAAGSGGAFGGTSFGVYGIGNTVGNGNTGGYFTNGSGSYAYVGFTLGGTAYKINGVGTVSTIVKNTKNKLVNLYCPESPEVLFQDFGTGALVNGVAHINMDETFAKNITVNEKHPLRVIIQLEGDCKGVFVTNKTQTGFDVKELQGGNSSISFTWFVSANRADAYNEDGSLFSNFENVRFGEAPGKAKTIDEKAVRVKTAEVKSAESK